MSVVEAPAITWPLRTTWQPRPYQLEALALAMRQNIGFDHGLGAGKTSTSLAVAEALGAMRVLVVCPSKVIAVWRDEVAENAARDWTVWHGEVLGDHGKPLKNPNVARRVESIIQTDAGARRTGRPFMAIVNYESLVRKQMAQLTIGTAWDMLIVDESHKIAGAGAKTSMHLSRVAKRIRERRGRVIIQTGTLFPHSALSAYGQMRTLNPDVLGTSWAAFKARYAKWRVARERQWCSDCLVFTGAAVGQPCHACGTVVERGEPIYHTTPRGDKIPDGVREDREEELLRRLRPWIHRVSQAELDAQTGLVEPAPQLRTCKLDADTRKAYRELERDLITQLAEGTVTSANAMVNVLRLAQVTSGYGIDAATDRVIQISDPPEKARLLADELDPYDTTEPIVVFARFHHDFDQIERICREQGRRYGEISGRRDDGLDGKYMAPDVDVVAVQPKSGGVGINLTRARIGIFYTADFSLSDYDQSKRRILRQGQTRHVAYVHLVCEDTIDEAIFYALKHRRDVVTDLLERLGRG